MKKFVLKVVMLKYSKRSCDDIGQLFAVMFQDSKVANSFVAKPNAGI